MLAQGGRRPPYNTLLVLESPARRAAWLGRGVPDGGVEREAVEVHKAGSVRKRVKCK